MLQIIRSGKFFVLAVILLLSTGCATVVDTSYFRQKISQSNSSGIILDIPFVKQKKAYCGPAALSSVLAFWGIKHTQEQIAKDMFQPDVCGVLNVDLEHYAKQHGLWAKGYIADFEALKKRLLNGMPVIVIEKLHPYILNRLHYTVIVGFSDEHGIIVEHTGKIGYVKRSYNGFLRNWQTAGNWMLEIMPAEEVSDDLTAPENIDLGLIFERKGKFDLALERYTQAQMQDEDNAIILFNIANICAKINQLDKAEGLYLKAIELEPEFADLYNNLADIYRKKHAFETAHEYVDKALSFKNKRRFYYLDTKAQIFLSEGNRDQAVKYFSMAESEKGNIDEKTLIRFYDNWVKNLQDLEK